MRHKTLLSATLVFLLGIGVVGLTSGVFAQSTSPGEQHHGPGFVDENGDGYNDRAPDADGDGIPNGMDPDYTGPKHGHGQGWHGFVDENNDGVNDWVQDFDGDGIINRFDPDYAGNQNFTHGRGMGHGMRGTQRHFIDMDGDGVNDRFQDFDGDGVINCQDPDWRASMGFGDNAGPGFGGHGRHHGRSNMSNMPRGNWSGRSGAGWNGHGRGFGRGFMGTPSGGNNGAGTSTKQMQAR